MEKIIGRENEFAKFDKYYESGKCEFVALYGRRRVGKTFLVRSYFKDKFDFYATGVIDGSADTQREAFHNALVRFGHKGPKAHSWIEAFSQLADLLERKNRNRKRRLVVFIDELPCFDTPKSGFLQALDLFWNSRGAWIDNIFFVVCGSATSWMIRNIVKSKAGLHKRTTHIVHLSPFNLGQVEKYLKSRHIRWPKITILQTYMILGGVPYYLSLLDPTLGLVDNIDNLFFAKDAELKKEYSLLFNSLFRNAEGYMEIIKVLSANKDGLSRAEIAQKLKISDNGHLCTMLDDLENCDFIRRYNNGALQKNGIFQLIDLFTIFFLKYCTQRVTDEHFWRNHLGQPSQNNWYGLTFEKVCLLHVRQIIHALHYDTIRHDYYAWRSTKSAPGAQIDLIIDLPDSVATICEMKYSKDDFRLDSNEYRNILRRMSTFENETKRKGGVVAVIVTTYSLIDNTYSEISPNTVTMEDLFKDF